VSVAADQLRRFKEELWKDQRRLETREGPGGMSLVKHFATKEEGETELYVLEVLSGSEAERKRVPRVVSSSEDKVELEYVRGIRLFNLLVELDHVPDDLLPVAARAKTKILARADTNQREIQQLLSACEPLPHWRPYQAGAKVHAIVRLLAPALDFAYDEAALDRELLDFEEIWEPMTSVPFRDATTKNMVLATPELWLGSFDGEDERREMIIDSLRAEDEPEWLSAEIVDFDFASCGEQSTPEDDLISLHFHERTWRAAPVSSEDLVWNKADHDSARAALTFITRYYRFGGRKAAYRLLHPWGHRVRFRHDRDAFYFERLPDIVGRLSPAVEERFPVLMDVTATIARSLEAGRPGVDQFIAAGLAEKRNYFVDMYWDRPPEEEC
jgi:hypothetical protein